MGLAIYLPVAVAVFTAAAVLVTVVPLAKRRRNWSPAALRAAAGSLVAFVVVGGMGMAAGGLIAAHAGLVWAGMMGLGFLLAGVLIALHLGDMETDEAAGPEAG